MPVPAAAAKAAQYVRMSTDHQQYSTANQKDAIAVYAEARGLNIVATYEDAGKSGLTFTGRPALRQLIADVAAGQTVFDTILVYDVSRWGRFQDADESAHLEYLCRLGGVRVEYCAEPFANDGTPFASICKVVKRALAAEYSRELSDKVFRGQHRLVKLGYRLGGSPGLGLRRCLVDAVGSRKTILKHGEYKNITTDRVILVPGPPDEIATVQRIYRDYVDNDMGMPAIADALNREGVRSESGRPWSKAVVKRILTADKYVGDSVWGRSSFKLQIARRHNARETWARFDGAFEGIVSRATFDRAQHVRAVRSAKLSDEDVIARLKEIYRTHGRITARLVKEDRFLGLVAIRQRFGSLITAYELAGFRPDRDLAFLDRGRTAMALRAAAAEAVLQGGRAHGISVERLSGACRFVIAGEVRATVTVAQERQSQARAARWLVKPSMGVDDIRIAALMDGPSARVRAFYFFPAPEIAHERLVAKRNPADLEAFRADTLDALFGLFKRRDLEQEFEARKKILLATPKPAVAVTELPRRPVRKPRLGTWRRKVYVAAYLRAAAYTRDVFERAEANGKRLAALREIFETLFDDASFVKLLIREGVTTAPEAAFTPAASEVEKRKRDYDLRLREAARRLLAGDCPCRRTLRLLGKLENPWRLEAAETMILMNDRREEFARALVAGTPPRGLVDRSRKRVYGADARRLREITAWCKLVKHAGKPALAAYGRNALDLVAVEAYARRLTDHPRIRAWLKRHQRDAFRILSSVD